MAHELTHNFGTRDRWKHVDCPPGVPHGINPAYPYPTDQIGPDRPDAFRGFDPITRAIINPDSKKPGGAADFMSYCGPEWVSDYTWSNIFNQIHLLSGRPVPGDAERPEDLTQSAEILW